MMNAFGIRLVRDTMPSHHFIDEIKRGRGVGCKPAKPAPGSQGANRLRGNPSLKGDRSMQLPFELVPGFPCNLTYGEFPNISRQSAFKTERFSGLPNTLQKNRSPQKRNKWAEDPFSRAVDKRFRRGALLDTHRALFR